MWVRSKIWVMSYSLGRIVQHDSRSLNYRAPVAPVSRSVLWGHHAPVLDQGQVGSCTGNATAQLINTDAFAPSRPSGYLTERDALRLYSLATSLDDAPGTYPPTDTGSSGLAVAQAGQRLGYFSSYNHAFGFDHFCAALQLQPLILGTNWYESMMNPNKSGMVTINGQVAGGHEYLALGVDYAKSQITCLNSWGSGWGLNGRFLLSFATMRRLLAEQGDVVAPVGRTAAPPKATNRLARWFKLKS